MIKSIINEEVNRKHLIYHSPLPRKKQRTTMRAERCGKVVVYNEMQVALYRCKLVCSKIGQTD